LSGTKGSEVRSSVPVNFANEAASFAYSVRGCHSGRALERITFWSAMPVQESRRDSCVQEMFVVRKAGKASIRFIDIL